MAKAIAIIIAVGYSVADNKIQLSAIGQAIAEGEETFGSLGFMTDALITTGMTDNQLNALMKSRIQEDVFSAIGITLSAADIQIPKFT